MSNILDRCKCQRLTGNAHTPTTLQHTHSNTHSDHTHLAHFAGVALVLVMLPAACCCQRPDWPGKRQIRRTIALDFYLSNVYGPLAGQPVAQSSEPTPSTHKHTTLPCSAYSLIKQFFSQFLLSSHIFYDIQLILMHTLVYGQTSAQRYRRYCDTTTPHSLKGQQFFD